MIDLSTSLINVKESIVKSGVIDLGMPDHNLMFAIRKFTGIKPMSTVKKVRNYKHFNSDSSLGDLSKMPWHVMHREACPNQCWRIWKSFFNEILDLHAPMQHERVNGNSVPCITPEIKSMMRNRDYHK